MDDNKWFFVCEICWSNNNWNSNALESKLISTIASSSLGDFFGRVFDKYIDGMDGSINGAIKIF